MAASADRQAFDESFRRWARRIRGRLALGRVLTGVAWGLLFGVSAAALAWYTGQGQLRPWAGAIGVLGALVGLGLAKRKRWNDGAVALFLDGRLGAQEAISTAHELHEDQKGEGEPSGPAFAVVVSQANEALGKATRKKVRPPMWSPVHVLAPLSAAAIAYVSWIPLPPQPAPPPAAPGSEIVQLADVSGLDEIIELADMDARDEDQRRRLAKISSDAQELKERLAEGMEKREAQAEIARLKDEIVAERLSLGEGERRAGLEAAIGALESNPDLSKAARALGDRDLTAFDEEMRRLAQQLEDDSRKQAAETLERAEEAAKKAGADDVAKELAQQRKLLEERMRQSEKLKELSESLGEGLSQEGGEALEDFGQSGDPKAQKKLVEELEKALGELSDEERKQLAENMKKRAQELEEQGGEMGEQSAEDLREMAKRLETPEGQRELAEQLKQMAQKPPESDEAKRQQGLDDAQRGAGRAEQQLGIPRSSGNAAEGNPGGKPGSKGGDKGGEKGGPGSGGDEGDHEGETKRVPGSELRSHTKTPMNQGAPMPGMVTGRAPGQAGGTANTRGSGALGIVGPGEVGALERGEVPEEYREQVGRYFQTK